VTRSSSILCAALALAAVLLGPRATREMPDLEVYWRAAGRAAATEPLYRADDGHYQFKYLPAFAILARPLAALSLENAKRAWLWISAAALAVFLTLSVALPAEARKPRWLLLLVTAIVMAKFYAHEMVLGQVNILLGAAVVGAATLMRAGREAPAGALIAFAFVVKPYAAIFLPWLAARRQIVSIATAALGVLLILLLPIPSYGWDGTLGLYRDWWRTVSESTAPNLLNPDNVSVAAMWAKWLGIGRPAELLAIATSLVLLAMAAIVIGRRSGVAFPEALEAGLLLTLLPLLSPQGWDYVFLLSTPAVVLLVNYEGAVPRTWRIATLAALATIAFSLYDVMGRRAYARFMAVAAISVCYLVAAAALYALRLRRVA
jgi:hypothetical protein